MSSIEKENIIAQTVKSYGAKLMKFIRPKVNNTEDAEDILQEVWYQLSHITAVSELVNVGSWLHSVATHKITDSYRKRKTEPLEDFEQEDEEGLLILKDLLLIDEHSDVEAQLFQQEIWDTLMDALEELPAKQRNVFVQNELEGFTLQQIADEQGENIKTIISRKQYAIKHLRSRMQILYKELKF